jgi:hypothetical protein
MTTGTKYVVLYSYKRKSMLATGICDWKVYMHSSELRVCRGN